MGGFPAQNIIQLHDSILYLTYNKVLHCFAFMGRNLDNMKELMPVCVMNRSKNTIPPKFSSVNLNL